MHQFLEQCLPAYPKVASIAPWERLSSGHKSFALIPSVQSKMSSMCKIHNFLLFIFLAGFRCRVLPRLQISDPGAKQMCASVKDVELPAADRPTPAEERRIGKAAPRSMLYFGFGRPADPVKARKCAYAEIDRDAKAPIGGKAILMMVYANGKGVPRNFDARASNWPAPSVARPATPPAACTSLIA